MGSGVVTLLYVCVRCWLICAVVCVSRWLGIGPVAALSSSGLFFLALGLVERRAVSASDSDSDSRCGRLNGAAANCEIDFRTRNVKYKQTKKTHDKQETYGLGI